MRAYVISLKKDRIVICNYLSLNLINRISKIYQSSPALFTQADHADSATLIKQEAKFT